MIIKESFIYPSPLTPTLFPRGERAAAAKLRRVRGGIRSIAFGLFASVVLSCFTPALAVPPAIPLYHASYSVGRNDLHIGTAQFSLSQEKNGTYTYKSVTQAVGLAALFFSDIITETSHFAVNNDRLQPLVYSYAHSGNDRDRSQTIRFDWSKHTAHDSEGSSHHVISITEGTYDRALAQLALSVDMAAGHLQDDYRVLDQGKFQSYRLKQVGVVRLKTPAGEYDTVEVARHEEKHNRTTTFWLAPKLDYLPAQMQQTEPGKATITLVLTEIRFDTSIK